jgi:hypothetical protein
VVAEPAASVRSGSLLKNPVSYQGYRFSDTASPSKSMGPLEHFHFCCSPILGGAGLQACDYDAKKYSGFSRRGHELWATVILEML